MHPTRTARNGLRPFDARLLVFVLVVAALALLSWAFVTWFEQYQRKGVESYKINESYPSKEQVGDLLRPVPDELTGKVDPVADPVGHQTQARQREIDTRFRQGAAMLHAGRYDDAATALHRVLALAPTMAEAHVNMGFALLGLVRDSEALAFFQGAADLDPMQTNAYYGMALAYEGLGNMRLAVETMEAYLHLEKEDEHFLRLAGAAVWEWRAAHEESAGMGAGEVFGETAEGGEAGATPRGSTSGWRLQPSDGD